MAYSEAVARRIRQELDRYSSFGDKPPLVAKPPIVEKKMFGGLGFLWNGNMCLGVWKQSLIVRVGPDQYQAALREPDVEEFDITGRPMRGWVLVSAEGLERDEQLRAWLERAVAFVKTLPRK